MRKNMEIMFCRVFQMLMKVGMYALPWRTPKTMKGAGAVKKLPAAIQRQNLNKSLIVTDKMLMNLHLLDGLISSMDASGVSYAIYDGVEANPTDLNIEEGASIYRKEGCDCIIAFGGGSPMDCAKGIGARIARPRKEIHKMQRLFGVLRPIPTIFAVPTTAGTGSETTIAAVVTEAKTINI